MDGAWRQGRRDRAQSSVLGTVLLLGLTLTAASGIVVLGSVVLDDSQRESQIGQAEQAMTQFDSRAAQVALGDSTVQTVQIGQTGGDYRVDPDAGHVWIEHVNRTADNGTEHIYDAPLGAVVYERDDEEIAYQGGGVWRKGSDGATMVSPPEFHYRRATLTFPLIRVRGDASASGDVAARVTRSDTPGHVFPNQSNYYEKFSPHENFTNPIEEGTMRVTVDSQYCQGWQTYFESRTEGDVSDCEDGNVTADLLTLGAQGDFRIDEGAEPIELRGMDEDDPLEEFELTFKTDSSPGFTSSTEWNMRGTDEDGNTLEIGFRVNGSNCGDVAETGIYYNNASNPDRYASWVINESDGDAFEVECNDDEEIIEIDLLDATRSISYQDVEDYSFTNFETEGEMYASETIETNTYEEYDAESLDTVVQHYFGSIGDVSMEMEVKPSGNPAINEDSVGTMSYGGDGRVVTFLHVTENEIEVRFR